LRLFKKTSAPGVSAKTGLKKGKQPLLNSMGWSMKTFDWLVLFLLGLIWFSPLGAARLSIKPYFGYAVVNMSEVNDDMVTKLDALFRQTGVRLPPPESFGGNYAWGFQMEYHWEEEYFVNVSSYFYREPTEAWYSGYLQGNAVEYHYQRTIEYLEFTLGLHYFFRYSTWKRINWFIGSGVGVGIGWNESTFYYSDASYLINNKGDFSTSAMSAYFSAGITFHVTRSFYFFLEPGYRVAPLREMTGRLTTPAGVTDSFTTPEKYDFSGFFIMAGVGLGIPLL